MTLFLATESDLLYRIKSGDHSAERELFKRYSVMERIENMVHARVQAPLSDRRDLIGDILFSILISLRKGYFDPQRGEIGSYIWGIARNKIRDYMKPGYARQTFTIIEEILLDEEDNSFLEERRDHLKAALSRLDQKYREVIFMRYYEEMSINEMARKLRLEPPQVYNRIH